MSILILFVIPIALALLGKLFGLATAASFFYGDAGRRLGHSLSRWCAPGLPILYLIVLCGGGDGDAATGVRLFGSETLFGLCCALPLTGIPILGVYAGVVYVIRDLTVGHGAPNKQEN